MFLYHFSESTLYDPLSLPHSSSPAFLSSLCLCSALVGCASLPESSQCNGILHNTELVSVCRSHICHHRMLITVNPFTSRKAGANTARAVEYLYPIVPKSGYVFYTAQITLCQLCLLTISHCELPSRLCGPAS